MQHKLLAVAVLLVVVFVGFAEPADADDRSPATARPLAGPVVRDFVPPEFAWSAGHRGVDLGGAPGHTVVAARDGRVSFAGPVAGRSVISVTHPDGTRTTYEPVEPSVAVGDMVTAGDPIGVLTAGHCTPEVARACLHFGLRDGDRYLDPRPLLAGDATAGPVRLLPATAADQVARRAQQRAAATADVASGPTVSTGAPPADGPVTSRFGTRRHPITGVVKLHDGVDIGAACGSPIRVSRDGTVASATFHPAYGWWLIVDHHDGWRTGYAHASRWAVAAGDPVVAGQHVGAVGSTGYSTGCHLHFMAWSHGRIVDPSALLGLR